MMHADAAMNDLEARIREGEAAKAREVARARDAGEWNRVLALADSQTRAVDLVAACHAVDDDEARTLLAEWFNSCDALAPYAADLREQFERVGYVTDMIDEDPELILPVAVYRAQWSTDDPPVRALSWTTQRETAEFFARYLLGPRAWFLGIKRDDASPWIWRATCHEAYGYITGRGEAEVIPKRLTGIKAIGELRTS